MNLLLLLIPTVILAVTMIAYGEMKIEIGRYVRSLEEMVNSKTEVMKLLFVKRLLQFFGESRTSARLQALIDEMSRSDNGLERGIEGLAKDAASDIGVLDSYLGKISEISESLGSVATLFSTLRGIILTWGVLVSTAQYLILAIYFVGPFSGHLGEINLIFLSSMMPLVGSVFIIILQLNRRIQRLRAYEPSLQEPHPTQW